MAVNTVGRVDRVSEQVEITGQAPDEVRRRLDLYRSESFERGSVGADVSGVSSFLDAETRGHVDQMYAGLSDADRAKLVDANRALGVAILANAGDLSSKTSAIGAASSTAVATYLATTGATELTNANTEFMYMAVSGMEDVLKGFAERTQNNANITKETRTSVTELNDMLKDWPDDGSTQTFSWNEVAFDEKGNPSIKEHTNEPLTKEDAQSLAKQLDTQLTNSQDMGELAKFDLQKTYQDYTQAVSTLANIQKQMYDDAMKVLNNLKA